MSSKSTYVIRRAVGLILYGLAYTALWPGLTFPAVSIHGNPSFWSSNTKVSIGLPTSEEFLEPVSRSTVQVISDLWDAGYLFPCGLIVFFSVVSPLIKLLLILYGEIVGNIFRLRVDDIDGKSWSRLVDLRKTLRVIAKYQCVDVFVSIITMEMLNSDFIECDLGSGFYYFAFYSFVSIIASQVIDANPPVHAKTTTVDQPPNSKFSSMSGLDAFLLFCSISMFVVGITWALAFPILSVKILFQSKIVIGESVKSLRMFLSNVEMTSDNAPLSKQLSTLIMVSTVVLIPTLVVVLSCFIQCFGWNYKRSNVRRFTTFLASWALLDVFAVALLTSLFAFASFSMLRTSAPWGFYCVLMAAMSAYEVIKPEQVSLLDSPNRQNSSSRMEESASIEMSENFNQWEVETGDVALTGTDDTTRRNSGGTASMVNNRKRNKNGATYTAVESSSVDNTLGDSSNRSSSADSVITTVSVQPPRKITIGHSNFIVVIATIIKRLGLPFFMLKALGWAIFFAVWFLNSRAGSLDLDSLSATLKQNIQFVSSAIQSSLPYGVGMCDHLAKTDNVTFTTHDEEEGDHVDEDNDNLLQPLTCINKPYLHYEKHRAYEVLARWISGFPNMTVSDIAISVPVENTFVLTFAGNFEKINLSLFIGQCLGSIFTSDDEVDESAVPVCSELVDKIHDWENVKWSVEVEADCNSARPYVRNIVVDKIVVKDPMKIEQALPFGASLPFYDVAPKFTEKLKEAVQPILNRTDDWISWGPRKFGLIALLSHLVELNVDSHGGTLQFVCPKPH